MTKIPTKTNKTIRVKAPLKKVFEYMSDVTESCKCQPGVERVEEIDDTTYRWTQQEKDALKACVDTYKARIRPLVREADLYHILPRPDGRNWDGIEYYNPANGKGVAYLFKPSDEATTARIRLKGLDRERTYRLSFEDGTHPSSVRSAAELMDTGLSVTLEGKEVSELVFFEIAR